MPGQEEQEQQPDLKSSDEQNDSDQLHAEIARLEGAIAAHWALLGKKT
ncbi:hypothetical protein [Streptomyces catenulae]|uniref:Uncharacterized protein n=1 Tax=Streptomyces catenulae TaxID=66875 RepID=A0ABV2YXK1_9ACTN|nr:hypothetical protein [Streptomyces catenulae]